MTSPLVLRGYGRTVAVTAPAEVLDAIRGRLPPGFRQSDTPPERQWHVIATGGGFALSADDSPRGAAADAADAAVLVLSQVELWVAEHARDRVFVHAGCVVHDDLGVLLPGRSMSGKTSLTAALVRAGATYYSDEYAVLDSRGRVRPYPRPLAVRPYDGGASRHVPVADLGGRPGRGPATVALVAALRYDRDLGWDVSALTRGQAVLRLLDNTVPARTRPRAVLTALERVTNDAVTVAGTRGDADDAARRLLDLLAG